MERYKNLSGKSGITFYQLGTASISVCFQDGWVYTYDHSNPGSSKVETMKDLAAKGYGLNSYISRSVKKGYARKSRSFATIGS